MSNWEIWLLGIALAMDCFSVSIAAGISAQRWIRNSMTAMMILFGIFQAGMTLLGYLGISLFSNLLQSIDHWIAFGLLCYLGIRMIYESFKKEEEKSFNLLDYKVIVTMAIATSIDALAVGISFGCLYDGQLNAIAYPVCVIGLCSTMFSALGLSIGIKVGKKTPLPAEAFGGVVLMAIGIKILIEHLC